MKKPFGLLLLTGIILPLAGVAQAPAGRKTDLWQLVSAMQHVVKPTAGQPPQMGSHSSVPQAPLPLLLDDRYLPLDSLNHYTLQQVASVTLDQSEVNTALFGTSGAWGVIRVKLKSQASSSKK